MELNKLIFSRTTPTKKIEIVETLNPSGLLTITPDTVKRMLREVGFNQYKSHRDKELCISREFRSGNDWNSEFTGVRTYKSGLYVDLYVQYSNTDTGVSEAYDKFFASGDYRGCLKRNDRYGNPRTYYFTYTSADKAECVKSLILQYIHLKYKERLGEN